MNLLSDFINELVTGVEQRMDAAGIPRIVREKCPFCCDGDVCHACNSRGYVLTERINLEAA